MMKEIAEIKTRWNNEIELGKREQWEKLSQPKRNALLLRYATLDTSYRKEIKEVIDKYTYPGREIYGYAQASPVLSGLGMGLFIAGEDSKSANLLVCSAVILVAATIRGGFILDKKLVNAGYDQMVEAGLFAPYDVPKNNLKTVPKKLK